MDDDFFNNFEDEGGSSESAREVSADMPSTPAAPKKTEYPRLPMSRAMIVTIVSLVIPAVVGVISGILAAVADLEWSVWQYIIGIGGGVSATLLLGTAIYWLDEKNLLEYHLPVVFLLIAISILNFVLRCSLGAEEYKILFICLSFILVGLSFFFCFHLIDPHWIVTMAIGTAFSIAFLISGWIMPPWSTWQWIIGGMASLLFLAPIFVLERKGEFMGYVVSLILTAALLAANFILMRGYMDGYKTIFIWLSSAAILASLVSIAIRHQKGDGAWGKVSIVPLVGGVVLLLLGLLLPVAAA